MIFLKNLTNLIKYMQYLSKAFGLINISFLNKSAKEINQGFKNGNSIIQYKKQVTPIRLDFSGFKNSRYGDILGILSRISKISV